MDVARAQNALWIAPGCPRKYQVMRVFDARPPADHRSYLTSDVGTPTSDVLGPASGYPLLDELVGGLVIRAVGTWSITCVG
jgi:hypothetical protein